MGKWNSKRPEKGVMGTKFNSKGYPTSDECG